MASIEELFAAYRESHNRMYDGLVECLSLLTRMSTPPDMKKEDSTVTTTEETLAVPDAHHHGIVDKPVVAVPCTQIHCIDKSASGYHSTAPSRSTPSQDDVVMTTTEETLLHGTTTMGISFGKSKPGYAAAALLPTTMEEIVVVVLDTPLHLIVNQSKPVPVEVVPFRDEHRIDLVREVFDELPGTGNSIFFVEHGMTTIAIVDQKEQLGMLRLFHLCGRRPPWPPPTVEQLGMLLPLKALEWVDDLAMYLQMESVDVYIIEASCGHFVSRSLLSDLESGAMDIVRTGSCSIAITDERTFYSRKFVTVLCTTIIHCLCDGIGTAQCLHAWVRDIRAEHDGGGEIPPLFHDRRALRPRCSPRVAFRHPEYGSTSGHANGNEVPSLSVPEHDQDIEVFSGVDDEPSGVNVDALTNCSSIEPAVEELSLIYYTFTICIEIKLHTILRVGLRNFWFVAASTLPPFLIGAVNAYLIVRPVLVRLARRACEGEVVSKMKECSVPIDIRAAALVAEAAFGLTMPNGPIRVALVVQVEDSVVNMLLPLLFATDLRTQDRRKDVHHAAVNLIRVIGERVRNTRLVVVGWGRASMIRRRDSERRKRRFCSSS